MALRHDLTVKLQSRRRSLETKVEYLGQRQASHISSKYAYKGKSENAEVPIGATRACWKGIIGEKASLRRLKTNVEVDQWAQEVEYHQTQIPALSETEHMTMFEAVWLSIGRVVLFYKNGDRNDPGNSSDFMSEYLL